MEEATEHLVKLYLEKQGYLVIMNKKYQYSNPIKTKRGKQIQRSPIEIDVIAINPRRGDKIVGEVKGWFRSTGLAKSSFKNLDPSKFDKKHDRFKLINNKGVQKEVFKKLKEEYGSGFRLVLYIGNIYKPHKEQVEKFLKKLKINKKRVELVKFDQIMGDLVKEYIKKAPYENDQVIQTIQILDKIKFLTREDKP